MAAPPLILGALLLFLAWRVEQRRWRLASFCLGVACLAYGLHSALTDPRAFSTNASKGSGGPGVRTRF